MFRSLLFTSLAACLTAGAFASVVRAEFVPGEIHVKFKAGSQTGLLKQMGATVLNVHPQLGGLTLVKLPAGMSTEQGLDFFRSRSDVQYAEPNYIAHATDYTPNDPMYASQWALQKIKAPAGWDLMKGSSSVTIAIIDTGSDFQHPDLAAKMVQGYDFVNNDNDADDDNGHGTHCAGIAAGITNNGVGIAGLAINCKIMPIKVLSDQGSGSFEQVISGIVYGADQGVQVESLSLAGGGASQALEDAMVYAQNKGVNMACAAGNHGTTDKVYPGGFDECITVAATDPNDNRAGFSAYGDWVEVAAPGVGILSTLPDNNYGEESGTSMATPYVAGLLGLVKSAAPNLNVFEMRQQIYSSCDNVGNFVTKGRINVLKAYPQNQIGETFIANPTSFSMYEGVSMTGVLANLLTSNNAYVTVKSKSIPRVGQAASIVETIAVPKAGNKINSLDVIVEAAARSGVSLNVYMWNYTKSAYDFVKAQPLKSSDTKATMKVSGPFTKYVSNGQAKIIVRGIDPQSISHTPTVFTLKIDQAILSGRATN